MSVVSASGRIHYRKITKRCRVKGKAPEWPCLIAEETESRRPQCGQWGGEPDATARSYAHQWSTTSRDTKATSTASTTALSIVVQAMPLFRPTAERTSGYSIAVGADGCRSTLGTQPQVKALVRTPTRRYRLGRAASSTQWRDDALGRWGTY